jgi:prolyl-tRNA synthetase
MKDAYSFHADEALDGEGYEAMREAYTRMFTRMGCASAPCMADTGAIGGTPREEFQVLADSGEDAIAVSDGDDFAANVELAAARCRRRSRAPPPRRPAASRHAGRAHDRELARCSACRASAA